MSFVFYALVVRSGNVLTVSTDTTVVLSTLTDTQTYLQIQDITGTTITSLDLSAALVFEPALDLTQTVATFIGTLTDQRVARYKTSCPVRDQNGLYDSRITVFNPLTRPDLTVSYVSLNTPQDTDNLLKIDDVNDLVITSSSDTDFSNILVAIDGVFHPTRIWQNNLYVIDGFATMRISGRRDMLCVDTTLVGGHQVVPLTTEMVSLQTASQKARITLPAGVSFTDVTPFLVLDGFLYYPSEILTVKSATQAEIALNKIPLIAQFRHNPKRKYTKDLFGTNWSWGTPDVTQTPPAPPVQTGTYPSANTDPYVDVFVNKRGIPASTVQSDDFILSRIAHPHSFLVLVKTNALFSQKYVFTHTLKYGLYEYPGEVSPHGIPRYGCGLAPSYVAMSNIYKQNQFFLSPQDPDMDRIETVVAPDVIPTLSNERDQTIFRPFTITEFFTE